LRKISRFEDLLEMMFQKGASDLHLAHNNPITFRISGQIKKLEAYVTGRNIFNLLNESNVLSKEALRRLNEENATDFATEYGGARFRGVLTRSRGNYTCAIRRLNDRILTMEELGLPEFIKDELKRLGGMILVTGPTGSGKTTTLNSIIHHLNKTEPLHITTVEDPIEYVHRSDKAIVTQQEVGKDIPTFEDSMKSILRRDPDVILIGEMRDLESVSTACTAAETGHLVFGTLHTNTAASTISRITSIFPHMEQDSIRAQIASSLRIIINQRLLLKKGGGRVAAFEIMVVNEEMRGAIRMNELERLNQLVRESKDDRNVTMEEAVEGLRKQGIIEEEQTY